FWAAGPVAGGAGAAGARADAGATGARTRDAAGVRGDVPRTHGLRDSRNDPARPPPRRAGLPRGRPLSLLRLGRQLHLAPLPLSDGDLEGERGEARARTRWPGTAAPAGRVPRAVRGFARGR